MPVVKPLSRRTFLRSGSYVLALPFLEAMLPSLSYAQSNATKRFVTSFGGTVVGNASNPGSYGALPNVMPAGFKAFESIKDHISIISNMNVPTHANGTTPSSPASAVLAQHGSTPAPMLAGASSQKGQPIMVMRQTADQFVAKAIGQNTAYESLQFRVQALTYTGSSSNRNGIMSARSTNGIINALPPIYSPSQIYQTLFSNFTPPTGGGGGSTRPTALEKKASVLDLVLQDIKNLKNKVSGRDKLRLEQHFDEVRKIEVNVQRQIANQTGGGSTGGVCVLPNNPGSDPTLGSNNFSGWSNETARGEVMADMIAYALACDLTRVVSWMLTFEQVFLGNAVNQSTDMHDDSHNASSRSATIAANTNWHANLFAKLVQKLSELDDGGQTVLDNTFLSLFFAEGPNAHQKTALRHVVAGNGGAINLGQHFNANGDHPGKIQITGMQSVGVNLNTMNELSGSFSFLKK